MHKKNLSHYISSLLITLLGLLILTISFMALTPPVVRDELIHHLAVPKLYLQHGGIYEIPFMEWSYYPMNLNLLYMIPLYFGNDIAPKFLHFAFALLTALLIFKYLKSRTSKNYAFFGALFFLSIPVIVKLSITAYIDLGEIFFSFVSLILLLKWLEKDFGIKYLIWSGIMCGLALGTKYNGLVTLAVLGLFVPFIYSRFHAGKYGGFFRPVAYGILFVAVSLIVFSPWMIRNYKWTGNPIYPLYNQVFNPIHPDGKPNELLHEEKAGNSIGIFTYRKVVYKETGLEIALLPVRLFFQGRDDEPQYFDGRLNPFLLILTLFAFLPAKKEILSIKREKKILLVFSVLFFTIAFFSAGLRLRYISPIIPPLVLLSVFGLENFVKLVNNSKVVIPANGACPVLDTGAGIHKYAKLAGLGSYQSNETARFFDFPECGNNKIEEHSPHKLRRKISMFIVLLIPCFALFLNAEYIYSLYKTVDPIPFIIGSVSRDEYIEKLIPEYSAVRYINEKLETDVKILFIYTGKRGYYSEREYLLDEDLSIFREAIGSAYKPEEITGHLKNAGITHLLVNYRLFGEWVRNNLPSEKQSLTQAWFNEGVNVLFVKNGFGVLAL